MLGESIKDTLYIERMCDRREQIVDDIRRDISGVAKFLAPGASNLNRCSLLKLWTLKESWLFLEFPFIWFINLKFSERKKSIFS
jgi:hypothetical protein